MIIRYEGLALHAYPDTKGWTIGYGTRSYEGEVITQNEARARFQKILAQSVYRVMSQFPDASEDEIVALTSIYYNCWGGWLEIKKGGPKAMLRKDFCTLPNHSGLLKRRAEERALFNFNSSN